MKKAIVFLGVFSLTFLIGYFIVPNFLTNVDEPLVVESEPKDEPIIEQSIASFVTPTVNAKTRKTGKIDKETEVTYQEANGRRFRTQLMETGDFWSEEITAKSGETWIGLFNDGNNYFLKSTKIIVQLNNEKRKTVNATERTVPLFLVRNSSKLKPGEIENIFDGGEGNEINMDNGFSKDFDYSGEKYSLRVESETRKDNGGLDEDSQLILKKGDVTQILTTVKNGCNDCFWYLNWVGDLDRDGKLDFYLGLSNHYNNQGNTLFLSTETKHGKIVGKAAEFWITGC
jgi:hypothetical protein